MWDFLLQMGNSPLIQPSNQVAILGLDNAGKTCLLYRLKFDSYVNTVKTVGFNWEKVRGKTGSCKGKSFCLFDVPGQEKLRALWKTYTRKCDGILYIIDSADAERFDESKLELAKMARMTGSVPVIVVANKQDLPTAASHTDIGEVFGLKKELGATREWAVLPGCAITGEGVEDVLEQLYDMILRRRQQKKLAKKP
ncbi:ADP-ribosylation factor-like protein 4C [Paramacrobiotus metropolitanus]|uniref:ADP-ribosylation factor-like protein 4C n=1 Tax=Paramacrobiotus metropolitanus TaxID=2943436 RepID=UPI0024458211|nr:ADP-ribosylation factor-like protein 4C [Paramacrobiotus metropolitanus]